jgi:hypothetical protein
MAPAPPKGAAPQGSETANLFFFQSLMFEPYNIYIMHCFIVSFIFFKTFTSFGSTNLSHISLVSFDSFHLQYVQFNRRISLGFMVENYNEPMTLSKFGSLTFFVQPNNISTPQISKHSLWLNCIGFI